MARHERNRVAAHVKVTKTTAEAMPDRPDLVDAQLVEVREAMDVKAAERGRRVSGDPELQWMRETGLGLVELTFVADTEPA